MQEEQNNKQHRNKTQANKQKTTTSNNIEQT